MHVKRVSRLKSVTLRLSEDKEILTSRKRWVVASHRKAMTVRTPESRIYFPGNLLRNMGALLSVTTMGMDLLRLAPGCTSG